MVLVNVNNHHRNNHSSPEEIIYQIHSCIDSNLKT